MSRIRRMSVCGEFEHEGNAIMSLGGIMTQEISRQFYSAYCRGRRCFQEGTTINPYSDIRAGRHGQVVTFSRAFARYWREGYEDAATGTPPRYAPQQPDWIK